MKTTFAIRLWVTLIALFATDLFADGVVAETYGGKLIKLEWEGYGTEFQQVLQGADLKILDKNGRVVFDEAFGKAAILAYKAEKNDDKTVTFKLVIQSGTTKIDMEFHGQLTESNVELEDEIDGLVKALRDPNRKVSKGSLLMIECSEGKFTFKDLVLGVYGDV